MTFASPASPDAIALIDGDRTFTYGSFERAVDSVAARLQRDGLEVGDRLASSLPNSAELVVLFHATVRLGAMWIGLDPKLPEQNRDQLLSRLGDATRVDDPADVTQWMHDERPFERRPLDPDAPALIAFTSGTSGRSKGVVHSLRNILLPARVSVVTEPAPPGERIGTPLSLSIANIMILGPLSAYVRGSTAVILNKRWADGFANDVELHGVTRTFLVSALLEDLVAQGIPASKLDALDRVVVGGSGARPTTLSAFEDAFGVRPTMSYGLSEAPTGVVRESFDDPIGSGRGFALPHIRVVIRGESGEALGAGEEGHICLSAAPEGPFANEWTPMLGYLDDPAATRLAVVDGELRTGDLGRLDDDGALSVTGRVSDLIIRGGANISPAAIVETARALDDVNDVVVLGVGDDRLGERVVVFVESVTLQTDKVDGALSAAGHTFDEIVIVETLPRNAMGKVEREVLRSSYRAGHARTSPER